MKIKIKKLPSSNKFSYGGSTNKLGGDFTNNVTLINEGGTHESNPFEGVPFGVDKEGTPNLVEEGEVIWNDYVFSNRLTPTKKMLENIGFPEKYKDYSFALIAEELQKESAERPNDLISQRGLQDSMQRLIGLQEEVRNKRKDVQEKKAQKALENTFAEGGNVNKLLGTATAESTASGLPVYEDMGMVDPSFIDGYNDWLSTGPQYILNTADSEADEAAAREEAERAADWEAFDNDAQALRDTIPNPQDLTSDSKFNWGNLGNGLMRMAPLIANATDLIRNLKKPDYTEGDRVLQAANNAPVSDIKPEVEDINIRPIDRNYLLNQQRNQGNTMINQIGNQAINAQQAMANMMLANTQTQGAIGDSLIKMDEANLARQMQESEFNRGNDQFITQTAFQNFANNAARHQGIMDATKYSSAYNTQMDASRAQGISGAMGNMATSLSGVGTENVWKDIIDKHPSLLYTSRGDYKNPTAQQTVRKNGGRILDGITESNQTISNQPVETPKNTYLSMGEAANYNRDNTNSYMHPYMQDGEETFLYPEELQASSVKAFDSDKDYKAYRDKIETDKFIDHINKRGDVAQFIFDYGISNIPFVQTINSAIKIGKDLYDGNFNLKDDWSDLITVMPYVGTFGKVAKGTQKALAYADDVIDVAKTANDVYGYTNQLKDISSNVFNKGGKLLTKSKKRRK
jgi:hypothetical protein